MIKTSKAKHSVNMLSVVMDVHTTDGKLMLCCGSLFIYLVFTVIYQAPQFLGECDVF